MSFCSLASPGYICLSSLFLNWNLLLEAFISEKQRAPENRQCRELPGRLWSVGSLCVSVSVWVCECECVSVCVCGPKNQTLLKQLTHTHSVIALDLAFFFTWPKEVGVIPGSGRSPGEGNGNPLQFLPAESHGQRSLSGCRSWGRKESDTT